MIEQLLMSRTFRRWIEAWTIILMSWVLFSEKDAVTVMEWEMKEDTYSDMYDDFLFTPEEEQELEDRRDFDLKGDDGDDLTSFTMTPEQKREYLRPDEEIFDVCSANCECQGGGCGR